VEQLLLEQKMNVAKEKGMKHGILKTGNVKKKLMKMNVKNGIVLNGVNAHQKG